MVDISFCTEHGDFVTLCQWQSKCNANGYYIDPCLCDSAKKDVSYLVNLKSSLSEQAEESLASCRKEISDIFASTLKL